MTPTWDAELVAAPTSLPGAPWLRRAVRVDDGHGAVTSAVLAVTAHGVVEPYLDGSRVGQDVLSPGWSAYQHRLRYREHDVTALLRPGRSHDLALLVGRGWYAGRLGWQGVTGFYGDRTGASARLTVRFADGHEQVVRTDATWSAQRSPVVADDLYDGQTVDARVAPGEPVPVEVLPFDASVVVAPVGPPVVRHETLRPRVLRRTADGRVLLDFGQNLVGWLRFTVRGERGRRVTVRHAEVLEGGELARRPLRSAEATDVLVLSGGEDRFEPTFTSHGFRYAEIEGWPGELRPEDVEAVVVGSDLRRTGWFSCSDPLVDRLHQNIVWSLRGNTLDVPTDCPQRDERLGWTGDLAVFAPTAAFLFDVADFTRDWLADLRAEQRAADGRVPLVVPDALAGWSPREGLEPESVAIWSDAAVWVPWALWEAYGDRAVLAESLPSMVAHVDRVTGLLSPRGVWETGFQFGDWLDPAAPPDDPFAAVADVGVVATAALVRSVDLTARAARVLGQDATAGRLEVQARLLRRDFAAAYVRPDGTITSDAPAVYALAVAFGLLDAEGTRRAGDRLAALVAAAGYRIATGFAGTPYVCDALTRTGHLDVAYALLTQTQCPSWLYPVTQGATTVWERWDSMLPDGTVNPGEMTSFNHYALGAVGDWLHRTVGGITPLEPGYRRVRVAPQPGGGLTWARTRLDTPHGTVEVAWDAREVRDGRVEVHVDAPADVQVDVVRPVAPTGL